jgi:hypothetical protein
MSRRSTHLQTMKRAWRVLLQCSLVFVLPSLFAGAQEVKPTGEQVSMKWGRVNEDNGVRTVVSTEAEYNAHNRHGPITFYDIPFTNGVFSLSWKRDLPQKINLVFETEENGKPTHLFKVFVNGTPNKDHSKTDVVSLVTYESIVGSKKKKATVRTKKYHAEAGKWHTASVTFDDDTATIRIDEETYAVKDDRFRKEVIKCGVGHIWGTLETKNVIITKN